MGFFNKLRDIKDTVSYKLEDAKDFIVDKAVDTKEFVSDKTFDARYFISDKAEDAKDFIVDKAVDTKDFISDKTFDARYFISDKVGDVREFVQDKTFDAKDFITQKVKVKSKADVVEVTSYVLFPAQIPLKVLMSAVGKDSANSIQEKSDYLNIRINRLENYQSEGKMLNEKLTSHLEDISKVKELMHTQLEFFSDVFEKIHNRPTYNISFDGRERDFDELFLHSNIESDFALIDSYLLKIYDEDAGIMAGLMRSPVFAAILKFREKALKNRIDNAVEEVNACIDNMKIVNDYLQELALIAKIFVKELHAVEAKFWNIVYALSAVVDKKPDFEQFTEKEITLLDTNIKLVRIVVALLNTHLFEKKAPDANGLTPVNKDGVKKTLTESKTTLETI